MSLDGFLVVGLTDLEEQTLRMRRLVCVLVLQRASTRLWAVRVVEDGELASPREAERGASEGDRVRIEQTPLRDGPHLRGASTRTQSSNTDFLLRASYRYE